MMEVEKNVQEIAYSRTGKTPGRRFSMQYRRLMLIIRETGGFDLFKDTINMQYKGVSIRLNIIAERPGQKNS